MPMTYSKPDKFLLPKYKYTLSLLIQYIVNENCVAYRISSKLQVHDINKEKYILRA